jgi:hypothetical protein
MKVYVKRAIYVLLLPFVIILLITIIFLSALLWPVTFIIYGKNADGLHFFSWYEKLFQWHASLEDE